MYNHQDMIKQYRQADFRQRLSLFLECPALRNEFVRIEQNEGGKNSQESAARNNISRVRKFFWALGLFRP
jgi:hypothetical protein